MRIAIVLITFLGGFGFVLWKLIRGVSNSPGWPAIATLAFAASAFLVFWLRRLRSGVAASESKRQNANIAREVGDFSSSERLLLEAAAGQARTSLSDFVRRKAIEAAESDVLDRAVVTIAAADWERFEAWATAPAKDLPALNKQVAARAS